jgi:hypothetical protein
MGQMNISASYSCVNGFDESTCIIMLKWGPQKYDLPLR